MTTIEFCFPTTVLTVSGSLGLSQPGSSGYPRKNIQKKGKAVSRFLFLNPPFIFATCPLTSDGPSSSVSIFGFAGTRYTSLHTVVSSYLTFSPLPFPAVVFCYSLSKITPACAFHSGVPYPVRTFLSLAAAVDRLTFYAAKVRKSLLFLPQSLSFIYICALEFDDTHPPYRKNMHRINKIL